MYNVPLKVYLTLQPNLYKFYLLDIEIMNLYSMNLFFTLFVMDKLHRYKSWISSFKENKMSSTQKQLTEFTAVISITLLLFPISVWSDYLMTIFKNNADRFEISDYQNNVFMTL